MADYIILDPIEGEYKPLTFSDGALVIYGTKAEAEHDRVGDAIIAEIIIPKTLDDTNK